MRKNIYQIRNAPSQNIYKYAYNTKFKYTGVFESLEVI